ncbi:MAG: proprotein convertase P-domain-containing protein [Bacteroidota bacterium]
MQRFYSRWLLIAGLSTSFFSLSAQVFQGQTNIPIPPGAPDQTVGISESDAVVSGVGPLTGCLRVERVLVNMTHTWTGDIGLFLISPAGTVLELSTRNGFSQDDYLNTEFRDDAAIFIVDGSNPFTGTFRPEGRIQDINDPFSTNPLGTFTLANSFAGENADGVWTFLVNDYVPADVGEILNWEIEFSGDPNGTFDVDLGPDQSVCGGNSVVLTPTLNPSSPGAAYSWSTGETTSTISVSPTIPTTYSVTVTSGGCTAEDEITVSPGAGNPVTITSPTQTICSGESVTLTAIGGSTGATYDWSTGQSGNSITVSPTADEVFSVTLTEGGCTTTDDILIEVEEEVTASLSAPNGTIACGGENVSLLVSFTGGVNAGPYNVSIDSPSENIFFLPGLTVNDGGTVGVNFPVFETTTYTLTVTPQGNACPVNVVPDQVTITVDGPDVSISGPTEVCPGDPVTLTASGADSYSWSTGATTASITEVPLITTTYTVTGTTNGCSTTEEITVTALPPNPTVSSNPVQICEGQSSTLSVTDVAPTATFQWSTGDTGQNITVTPATTTTYQVTVTDGPCSTISFISVLVDPAGTADLIVQGPDEVCAGETVDLLVDFSGSTNYGPFDLVVQNPNGSDFIINDFTGTGDPDVTASFVVDETTTFTLSIIANGTGCPVSVGQSSVTVTVNDPPDVQITGDTEVCPGENVTLVATGADTYEWSSGQTGATIFFFMPFDGQSITVTGTTNGCSDQELVVITVVPLDAEIIADQPSICEGESITLTGSGGGAGASYDWSTGQTGQQITLSPTATETVSLTVTDGSCSDIQDFEVVVNPPPFVSVNDDFSLCAGLPSTLTATGGGFGASYQWSTGQSGSTINIFPLVTTTYTVTVTDNGCTNTDEVTVSVEQAPALELGNNQEICLGDNVSLFNLNGVTGNYQWSTGETAPAINVSPDESELYSVTLTEGNCSSEDQILVTVTDPSVDLGPDISICPGESTVLTATGPGSFLWSTNETTTSIVVNPDQTETYTVTRTFNGCTATDEIEVVVLAAPAVSAGDDQTICTGESITLTASGTGPFTWSTTETANQITVSPEFTTTYTVTAGGSTCQATDEITVFVDPLPLVDLGPDVQLCEGGVVLFSNIAGDSYAWSTGSNEISILAPASEEGELYSLSVTVGNCTGVDSVVVSLLDIDFDAGPDPTICPGESVVLTATGTISYSWTNGPNTPSFAVSPTATTTYFVTGNTAGCIYEDSVTVNVVSSASVSIAPQDAICSGDEVVLTASGTGPFTWSTGEVADQITVQPSATTTYTAQAGVGACQVTDEITIVVAASPDVDLGPDQQICTGDDLTLSTNITGDDYAWSTGSNQPSITVSPTATEVYTLSVTQNNCTGIDSVAVTLITAEVEAGADPTICPGESVELIASGTDSYSWTGGPNSQAFTVSPTQTTTYFVTGSTSGCTDQDSVTVNVVLNTSVSIAPQDAICPGDEVVLTASGTGPFTWSTGEVADQITVQPSATTTFVAQAGVGACQVTDSIALQVQPPIVFELGPDTTICAGQDLQLELAVANAQYEWSNGSTSGSANYAPLSPEIASVLVTVNGCTATDSLAIDINDPILSISSDTTICPGDEVQLVASGTNEFLWSTTATTASILVSPTETETFSVEGTTEGCSVTEEVTVTVSVPGNVELGDDLNICPGESVTLAASGTGPFTWSTNETGAEIAVSPDQTTVYTASIGVGNCLQEDSVSVIVLPQVEASIGSDTTICAGQSLVLAAQGTVGTYLWSTNETTETINVSPTDTTTYNLVTTANGCTDTAQVVVAVNTPTIEVSPDLITCPGDEVQLTASGTSSFNWSTGDETSTITVNPTSTEVFTVTGIDEGCSIQDSVRVEVRPLASLTIDIDQSICSGESIVLEASSDGPLTWSTGETSLTIEVEPGTSTTYTVIAGEGNCAVTDSVLVEVRPLPVVTITGEDSACEGSMVSLQADGPAGATYAWSTGEATPTIDFTLDSDRQFTVVADLAGCQDSTSFEVTALALPEVLSAEPTCSEDNASYQWNIELGGGTAPYFSDGIELSGNTLTSPSINSGDSILIGFTDANGCATSFDLSNTCGCLVLPLLSPSPRCADGAENLTLSELLPPDAPEGIWTVVSGPEDLVVDGDELITDGAAAGIYRLQFAPEGATLTCLSDYEVDLELIAPPSSGLQAAPLVVCRDAAETVDLSSELVGLTPGGSWSGISDNTEGNANFDEAFGLFNTQGQAGGSYIFRYTTAEGGVCPSVSSDIQIDIQEVFVEAEAISANCLIDCSGIIEIVNPDPLLLYGFDGDALSGSVLFENLCPGNYRLVAEDPDGCQATVELLVEEPILPQVEVGPDRELLLGDSLRINVQTTTPEGTVSWSPNVSCLDSSCLEVILQPLESTIYTLELVDGSGCTARDDIQVLVDRNRTAFAPTAFSPNEDGTNDRFTIYGDAGTVTIQDLSIFDRWGNRLFFAEELPLNDESVGWDGRSNGQLLNPGVFVYQFRAVWLDGREETILGEVTLLK